MFSKNIVLMSTTTRRNNLRKFSKMVTNLLNKSENIDNGILVSDSTDIVCPSVSLNEFIFQAIEPFHRYKAIECANSGKSYTYGELRTKSKNFGKFLKRKLNLKHGDVVAIILYNRPETPLAVLGILEAGLTIAAINPMYTPGEIAKQLSESSAKAVITQSATYATVQAVILANEVTSQIPIIVVKDKQSDSIHQGSIDFEEVINKIIDGPDEVIDPSDVAFLPFTSGTTGVPKTIEQTHRNLVASLIQQAHPDLEFSCPPSETHQDVITGVLPFFHIFGFNFIMLNHISKGVKIVTQPKFKPDRFVELLKNHPISFLPVTPPLVMFLTSSENVKSKYFKHLKYIVSGAAPLGKKDEERFLDKAGRHLKIYQGLGMSESALVATTATRQLRDIDCKGSVGKPIPSTIAKIVSIGDDKGIPLGPNQSGELLIKGPQVTQKYRNAPEANSKSFVDGWFRTGDIAYYDERGCIYIHDRLKEIIKVKGYQVAPAELEELLRGFPGVADAGVIGIPHPSFGEVPRAFVVPKGNTLLNMEDLEEYVNKNVISYKRILGGIEIIDAIPKNASGKILRRELKQKYLSENR